MNRKPSPQLWLGVACVVITGLVALFLVLRSHHPSPGLAVTTTNSQLPLVVIGPDGQASIQGVTLSNTNIRDAAFRALAASSHGNGLRIGPQTPTNSQQLSNLTATLNAAINTGLLRPATNKLIMPSLYD